MNEETRITRRGLLAGALGAAMAAILPKQAEAQPGIYKAEPTWRKAPSLPALLIPSWTLDISRDPIFINRVDGKTLRPVPFIDPQPKVWMSVELDVSERYLWRVVQAASERVGQHGSIRTQPCGGTVITLENTWLKDAVVSGFHQDEITGERRGTVCLYFDGGTPLQTYAHYAPSLICDPNQFGKIFLSEEIPELPVTL